MPSQAAERIAVVGWRVASGRQRRRVHPFAPTTAGLSLRLIGRAVVRYVVAAAGGCL